MIAMMGNDLNDGVLVVWGVVLGESVWPLPSPRPHPGPLPPSGRGGERLRRFVRGECLWRSRVTVQSSLVRKLIGIRRLWQ